MYKIDKNNNIHKHSFHLVNPSPWPILISFSSLVLTSGLVLFFHKFERGFTMAIIGLILVLVVMFSWFRDIIREGVFEGAHTKSVQEGLKLGMILFILTEALFFLSFFWGFFHSSLNPVVDIGCTWPPFGITPLNPWKIPFLNTLILLTSGATLTYSHYALRAGLKQDAITGLAITIILAAIFTGFQYYEYVNAPFSISDGIYGSIFYMLTGFHGFHVIIGTIFLSVCLYRLNADHFSKEHHLGFEFAAWYWHFVDVVWILLFLIVYFWTA